MHRLPDPIPWELGCRLPHEQWEWLNGIGIFENPSLRPHAAPFPHAELMAKTTGGLSVEQDFATHGVDIFHALVEASPVPIAAFKNILDFGCGCGRLARMFKGHPGGVAGCDIDQAMIQWVKENLHYVSAVLTGPTPPLPFSGNEFDAIISISVFTHLNEKSQDAFLRELKRIASRNGYLFLTVHGARALERAKTEKRIFDMLDIDRVAFAEACVDFENGRHAFIHQFDDFAKVKALEQNCHLQKKAPGFLFSVNRIFKALKGKSVVSDAPYQYGITFVSEKYLRRHWSKWFEIEAVRHGAIHDFQDIVVLRAKN